MARMTSPVCHRARPWLAEFLMLGQPLPTALVQHVAACRSCARQVKEIDEVVSTLRAAQLAPIPAPPSPAAAPTRPTRQPPRSRRRVLVAVFAALAAVFLLGGLLTGVTTDRLGHRQPTSNVRLTREGLMIPRPWGTEIPVLLSGLRPGQTYHLMTGDAIGHRVPAGSIRTAQTQSVHTRMVSAMSRESIVLLLVTDPRDQTVARMPVTPQPSGAPTR